MSSFCDFATGSMEIMMKRGSQHPQMEVSRIIGLPPVLIHFMGFSIRNQPSSYGGFPMTMESPKCCTRPPSILGYSNHTSRETNACSCVGAFIMGAPCRNAWRRQGREFATNPCGGFVERGVSQNGWFISWKIP